MIYALMQLLGGIILSCGWVPQIIQIVRTKSVEDLNKKTFILLFVGIGLMEVYGVHLALAGVGYAFLVTNTLSLFLIMIILSLIWKYK
ncbi:MtN3 and saliva related transmembrane protein [Paenibacillus sp. DS2015]|uniref:SemiSWEET family sugar transporter n=1 Tax=Paenibacillus sp. DS2015 TaxID=3373917 RepID=UPI003D1F6062